MIHPQKITTLNRSLTVPAGPSPRRGAPWFALAALLCLFILQFIGALLPNGPLLCAATAGGLALDLSLRHWQPGLLTVMTRLHGDEAVRQLLRDLLIVIGLAHLSGIDTVPRLVLVGGLLACYAAHFACRALGVVVRRTRTLPIVTRNIDTSALRLSPAPPRPLIRPGRRMPLFAVPGTTGLMATVLTDSAGWGLLGVGVSLALFAGSAAYLATWLLPGKRPPDEQRMLAWFRGWLAEYRPEVGIYFSGGNGTAYQANMWLSTLAALDGNTVVVLRERGMVQQIAATDVPIVCLPRVAHLMLLEQSSLKMLLHPANAPKTSQILRVPSIKHAFTNHGESDKLSSCNPYAKVYDQVWVAGPAARKRYALADVGVDDRDVVEVGRPQLAPIRPYAGPPDPAGPVSVLYAPTWEGWTDAPGNTSVLLAGENIVRALLADPRVRLLYKPHPMTGTVNPRAGEADARIRTLIARANATPRRPADAERGAVTVPTGRGTRGTPPRAARAPLAAELARRTAELNELTARAFRPGADEVERMIRQTAPPPGRAEAVAAATEAWRTAFWAAQPARAHLILTGSRPDIYSCFNQADLLISDVSSVVADYLASTKPYAVVNTSGLSEADFHAANPTTRAATVLGPDAHGIPALLDGVLDPARDAFAAERTRLKEYLLGPSQPPSQVRFQQAVHALCAAADARRARQARLAGGGTELPIPRSTGHTASR
ncbi:CDP-Glycerol:Poly(glycerophosphate) glycerophosphotransferase [Streptomyces sp. MP131-18]|nr:CDP-Glycerol:Poly(glycerophosphate) glycerophosphotransferase [Streptomyces sp. MP131-18]